MSFPTTNQTAFTATTFFGVVSMGSFYQASRSNSTISQVGLGVLGLLGAAGTLGCSTAWMRSTPETTPKQYLQNAYNDTGVAGAAMITAATQTVAQSVLEGASQAIQKNIYDAMTKKPDDGKKKSGV